MYQNSWKQMLTAQLHLSTHERIKFALDIDFQVEGVAQAGIAHLNHQYTHICILIIT